MTLLIAVHFDVACLAVLGVELSLRSWAGFTLADRPPTRDEVG